MKLRSFITSKSMLTGLVLMCMMMPRPSYCFPDKYFRQIDIHDGLSQNTVHDIIQDCYGFMWFATKNGLNRYDGVHFQILNSANSGLKSNFIYTLYEESRQNIWIGTEHGVFIYNHTNESVVPLSSMIGNDTERQNAVIPKGEIRKIFSGGENEVFIISAMEGLLIYDTHDKTIWPANLMATDGRILHAHTATITNNQLWVGCLGDNLYFKDLNSSRLIPFTDNNGDMPMRGSDVEAFAAVEDYLYIGTTKGLFRIDLRTHSIEKVFNNFVRTLRLSSDNHTLIAGTQDGLFFVNLLSNSFLHIQHNGYDEPFALSDNAIYSLEIDRDGGLWIGSYFGGINYLPMQSTNFEKYYPHKGLEFVGQRIREMVEDKNGNIWIGSEDKGLLLFNPEDRSIKPVTTHLHTNNIHGLCIDSDELWIGAFDGGLERLNLSDMRYKTYFADGTPGALNSNYVFAIHKDHTGRIWIGTNNGLMYYDRESDSFRQIDNSPIAFFYNITEDRRGILWLASYNDGLYSYDPGKQTFRHHKLPDSKIISLFEDSRQNLWVMTHEAGLIRFDRKSGKYHHLRLDEENKCNIVYKMVEDVQGNLWCSTNNGLVCYNLYNQHKKVFTTTNGLQCAQFNYQSGMIDRKGFLYFGSTNGFIRFRPDTFMARHTFPVIAFSELQISDRKQNANTPGSAITTNINVTDQLTLNYDQNTFTIIANVLSYSSPQLNIIEYRMDGLSNEWHKMEKGQNAIHFTNLAFGHYTLHVRGYNDDGVMCQDEKCLSIHIRPPFYLSWWAWFIYTLTLIAVAYFIIHTTISRNRQRLALANERLEKEMQHELFNSKMRFFTNIAHEIRTPLTLIKSPVESCLQDKALGDNTRKNLEIISQNTDNLITLVNQLLDFRKIENDSVHLNMENANVTEIITSIVSTFQPSIKARNITHCFDSEENITTLCDISVLSKIINNLMSNALKYSRSRIDISLHQDANAFIFTISNDGNIIPANMREEIFKPFTTLEHNDDQNITSTGLGLPLARAMAQLLDGSLKMDSDMRSNCFILRIPIRTDKDMPDDKPQESTPQPEHSDSRQHDTESSVRQNLLIVEDNIQLAKFIADHFNETYNVSTAHDGLQAVNIINTLSINIVVSDIMMPGMDGLELCQHIKQTTEHSHIPVILLTAKATIQDRLAGLRHGADAYIDKPFSMSVLEQTISTTLENRRRVYEKFTQRKLTSIEEGQINSEVEAEFLKQLKASVSRNIDNPEYGIEQLKEDLFMSRSTLNRKIKAITNLSPNDYIRRERLNEAKALLLSRKYRINEVCYMVGFNTPSYFAKCFYNQFGVLPSDI